MWGRTLTKGKLFERGIIDNPICVLCNAAAETACHLFVSCPFVQLVWDALIGHLDRATTVLQPAEPRSILSAWPDINTRGIGEDIWRVLPYSVLWVLWTARNEIVFCQGTFDLRGIIKRIKCMIWAWLDINSQRRNLKKDHQVTELLQGWELVIRDQW
ncbi:hypothetical protein FRX31_012847 [Thalictrum thalictroides]|uniref:Reverse transcriptase zinc-binding domain-containing protein n=1 Tax=Thalictrum thalictroides TaxID=46969 RepID=A0A7J6WJL4_THATH|nr:hypothetical protein FRX31_012847 [Thalictrum thalictroides]